ncbi:hypothetical protein [Thiobaca trueperi]|uniref:Uncharacterized protein n=1 Tax=Thiobaca trueperi TaxID=127458 RepID=A0A4R3MUV7_9GAMM|nr:hypothetical protein [Thiobaca trueperi]TCT20268.1 hypothetical protein EDC35_106195 [Thiobaca trueperi]
MLEQEALNHWRFFISLEKDLMTVKDYIEIAQDNYNSYSFELSKILQLSCAEIDCICRLLCKEIDPSTDYQDQAVFSGNIAQYRKTVLTNLPKLPEAEVHITTPGINAFRPWADWQSLDSPTWWKSYNNVKHYRHVCFKEANLKNVLEAMAALMIIASYLYRTVVAQPYANPMPPPKLFTSEYTSPFLLARANSELPDFA